MKLTPLLATIVLAAAAAAQPKLEIVAQLDRAPGNITITPDHRIILSLHQHFAPTLRVAELHEDGSLTPFPNAAWNESNAAGRIVLDSVLGLQCDPQGVVWLLDNGMSSKVSPKLVAWDTRTDRLHRVIHLPSPVTRADSFVNDLAVDLLHNAIYIADPAGPHSALIVVDLHTGLGRRVLEGHPSVTPENVDLIIDANPVQLKRPDGTFIRPRVGVNPIFLDVCHEWLYFGAMHGRQMSRVRTADLRNPDLSLAELAQLVQPYAPKPISDGSSMDAAGNIYVSDVGHNALGVITPDRKYAVLIQDDKLLSWPDAFSFGPDGYLYLVSNQLHRGPVLNAGKDVSRPPFYVLRFKPLAAGIVGR